VSQLEETRKTTIDEIDNYKYRMEVFEQVVATVQAKFKRLQGDWLVKSTMLDQLNEKMLSLSDKILLGHKMQSQAISTLVELEFIQ